MTRHVIEVGGKEYPCYQTMGASLMYKRQTGEEASAVGLGALSGLITLLWCLTACACDADGVDFPYKADVQAFANRLSPESFTAWCEAIAEDAKADASDEKKSRPL